MFHVGLTAKDVMNSPVIKIKENTSVEEVADIFAGRMISGAPVVNENGKPIGVVTMYDIVRSEPRREHIITDKVTANNVLTA